MLPQLAFLSIPLLSFASPIHSTRGDNDLSILPAKVLLTNFLAITGLQGSDQFVATSRPLSNKNNFFGIGNHFSYAGEELSGADTKDGGETSVAFERCRGSDVSEVKIEPCEGGTGDSGSPCVFTDKQ